MAIYFLAVKSFGRSAGTGGSVSTSAAAYRAGEKIRDERTGRIYDHSDRRDVDHKEIILPSQFSADARLDWARDRSRLWNLAERAEPRANARVAREYVLALPHELTKEQRTVLARTFAQELSDRNFSAVDLAVHQPRTDPRNFHAHLLSTTREVTANGLGAKTIAELTGSQRFELGLPRAMQDHGAIRARWADLANQALHAAGLGVRVSHIPDADAVLRPGAKPWLPRVAWEIERRGGHSVLGDRAREEFARRRQVAQHRTENSPSASAPAPLPAVRQTPEEIRERAILEWRAIRAEVSRGGSPQPRVPVAESMLSGRPFDIERQIGSLRRELGRDDYGL